MARPVNKELQFAADQFLAKVRAFFPEAEIVEIKDNHKTVFRADPPGISLSSLLHALEFDGQDAEIYAEDRRDHFAERDADNEYGMYGYFDALVLVYRNKVASIAQYDELVSSGRLRNCPVRPDTFYHNCWRQFGGWEGFLWYPGKADPEEDHRDLGDDLIKAADLECVSQANWTYRTSTIQGYRASIAAGALRGAPLSPEEAWPNPRPDRFYKKFLWPRNGARNHELHG